MIIFDEKKYAEELLKDIPKNISTGDLLILAKYFRHVEGIKTRKLREKLLEICNESIKEFSEVLFSKNMKFILDKSKQYILREFIDVPITKKELIKIHELNNQELENIVFIFLFLCKNYKLNPTKVGASISEHNIINYKKKWSDIRKLANTNLNVDSFEIAYSNQLNTLGYGEYIFNVGLKLLFVDMDSEPEILIRYPKNVLLYYYKWLGEKIIECSACGCLVKPRSNRQKMCKECAYKKKLEDKRVGAIRK